MNTKQLKRGNELEKEIAVIKAAQAQLASPRKMENFWLHISAHQDGSGAFCNLIGANVAIEMLGVIRSELENQLAKREAEFKSL